VRITQRAVALTSLQGLNRNLDAVGRLQQQLTSGRLINAPSDSPTGTNKAMQTRAEQAAVAQQGRNISDAKGWLEQADSSLREMLDTTRRVRDLTVQGLNTGAGSDTSRQALAPEVVSLRDGLLSLENTPVQGRPIFGGVTPGAKAYNSDGTWAGLAGPAVTRRLSEGETVRVDLTGREAFGPDGTNLFDVVGRITTNVTANPAALEADLTALDGAVQRMSTSVADIGSRRAGRARRAAERRPDARPPVAAGRDRERRPARDDHEAPDAAGRL